MSNIEDRDEKTYLNGFEEQTELPYDWDSEEAQGTKEELMRSRAYTDTDEYYSTTFGQSGVYDTTNDADVGYVTTSGQ